MPSTLAPTPAELEHAANVRRALHRIPEIAYEEVETAAAIRSELTRLGIPFIPGPTDAPTATIAVLGDPAKPCIALRADIDALPIHEQTGLPHASTKPGRMHACGHDGHTANLLLTAAVLKRSLSTLPVCVKLIFQPAEEGGGGADVLVQASVLDGRIGPKVSAVFGLHCWPGLPVGVVTTKPGPLMASTDTLRVTIRGRGSHAALPHLSADPILAACETVVSLQALVSRETNPTDSAVVTVGLFNAGTATNIIPDTASFQATVRTLTDATRQRTKVALIRRVNGIAAAHDCTAEIEYEEGYPATTNDPAMAERVANLARTTPGVPSFIPAAAPVMGGEDFSYYLQKVPGAFFMVGVLPHGRDSYPSLHNDHFDFHDAALPVTCGMFLSIVESFRQ